MLLAALFNIEYDGTSSYNMLDYSFLVSLPVFTQEMFGQGCDSLAIFTV